MAQDEIGRSRQAEGVKVGSRYWGEPERGGADW